ncbi:MAG: YbjQ family protein [Candidatus Geothermarchaeales archaeon]
MSQESDFLIVTTPSIEGYRIREVLGLVTGLTARTRGVGGKFVAGLQSLVGGEVSAFTSELEKARGEALKRVTARARGRGGNAIVSLDLETTEVFEGTVLISVTGTAVVVEKL